MANFVFTYEASPAPVDPSSLTVARADDQIEGGDVQITADMGSTDENVEVLYYLATTAKPSASDFGASSGDDPSDGLGGGYLDGGTITISSEGEKLYFDIPDGMTSAEYKIAMLPAGGVDADVVEIGPITIDTSPPVLAETVPADAATGVGATDMITLTYNKALRMNDGTVTVRNVTDGTDIAVFTIDHGWDHSTDYDSGNYRLNTYYKEDITIVPRNGGVWPSGKEITVHWSAGVFKDVFENLIEANTATLFSFTVA